MKKHFIAPTPLRNPAYCDIEKSINAFRVHINHRFMQRVAVTLVQATFVLGMFVHIRNISAVTESI